MEKEELIANLSGQVINGLLSSNNSLLSKLIESTFRKQMANIAVDIAANIADKIFEKKMSEPQQLART